MSKQKYSWLLALSMMAASQASNAEIDPEDSVPAWSDITAKAGRMNDASAPSANDAAIAAALFNLVLIFVYCSAIYRAKPVNFAPDFCKITGGEISEQIRSIQHSYWAARYWLGFVTSAIPITSPHCLPIFLLRGGVAPPPRPQCSCGR